MNLPHHLRAALEQAVPSLKQNPDKLLMFIEAGGVCGAAMTTLSFRYRYTLILVLVDFSGHPDEIMVPLLAWLQQYQPELIQHPTALAEQVKFDIELISHQLCDIELRLPLTEGVTVTVRDGQTTARHTDAPYLQESVPLDRPYLKDELILGRPD